MSILRPLVEEFTVEPFCSSTIVRYTLQPPGEGDNAFERGFIRLDTNNQRGLGQVLSVAGYTEHETGSIIFPGIVSIGMSTITHEARGPPTVDLRNVSQIFPFYQIKPSNSIKSRSTPLLNFVTSMGTELLSFIFLRNN